MRRVDFHRPASLDEALALRARWGGECAVLAGGTDLLIALREQSGSRPPLPVIDLTGIEALRGILESGPARDVVRIAPLTSHDAIERSALLRSAAPLLCQASSTVGSPQIRHRGTIGGNIANAASCADTMPPLVALGAILTLSSRDGTREVPVSEFTAAPYRTLLGGAEIITAITFPALAANERSAFLKLGRRNALSISRLSVAVVLEQDDAGRIRHPRIAGGSILPAVRRFPEAESCLEGAASAADGPPDEAIRAAAAALTAAMVRETGRRWSTPYKEPVAQAMVARTIRAALSAPPGAGLGLPGEASR